MLTDFTWLMDIEQTGSLKTASSYHERGPAFGYGRLLCISFLSGSGCSPVSLHAPFPSRRWEGHSHRAFQLCFLSNFCLKAFSQQIIRLLKGYLSGFILWINIAVPRCFSLNIWCLPMPPLFIDSKLLPLLWLTSLSLFRFHLLFIFL